MNFATNFAKPSSAGICGSCCFLVLLVICLQRDTWAWSWDENPQEQPAPSLEQRAIALLQEKCSNCHGSEKREGDLSVVTRADLVLGGSLGTALDTLEPQRSLLLRVIRGEVPGLEMPPKNPLTPDELEVVQKWLESGALWTDTHSHNRSSDSESHGTGSAWEDPHNPVRKRWLGERLNLWSLNPITRPNIDTPYRAPEDKGSDSKPIGEERLPRNSIDVLVDQRREELKQPIGERVDKATLIRRLYLDVTGLPPDHEAVQRFLDDPEADAYDKWVDRLLSSPSYGEHFGRLWLDVIRYSDSNGFDWDEFRPQVWQFRNYVIDAWNEDIPYDQFILEQLAGDELLTGKPQNETDLRRLIATGFLRLGPYDHAAPLFNEQERSRSEFLSDITETTGSAFLGQTLACCRCHDHKTDPWLQSDYYRLKAFFAAVEFGDQIPLELETRQNVIQLRNAKIEAEIAPLQQRIDQLAKIEKPNAEQASQIEATKKEIQQWKQQLLQPQTGFIVREEVNPIPTTFVLYQGNHLAKREQVEPGIPAMFQPQIFPVDPATSSTGRRLALAKWIASPQNPWTASVLVNRLWQFHFGEGIVRTPNDFGWSGERPESIQLLDWLAIELIRNDWSIKHIQRLILTSRTYQEATFVEGWPRKLKRLSAEQIRDSMLAVSGLLQVRRPTTPIWPPIPKDVLTTNPATLDDNETQTKGWYPSPTSEQTVRSIYLVQKRTIRIPFMETFDLPDNSVSCGCRTVSIVAPQALTLLNGNWGTDAAEALAAQIQRQYPDSPSEQIHAAYRAIFQRKPSDSEQQICVEFRKQRSIAELVRALLNTNEFAFVE